MSDPPPTLHRVVDGSVHPDFKRAAGGVRQIVQAMDDLVMIIGPPWKVGSRIATEVVEDPRYAGGALTCGDGRRRVSGACHYTLRRPEPGCFCSSGPV